MNNENDTTDIDAIERRGYSRGYQAGRRRVIRDEQQLDYREKKADFWREVFVMVLGETIDTQGWKVGETPIVSVEQRVALAASFADEAMNYCHKALT